MKKIILIGNKLVSQMFADDLRRDGLTVVAFAVDPQYITDSYIDGIPVVPLDELGQRYDHDEHEVLAFIGPSNNNELRVKFCRRVEDMGFQLGSYVSINAKVWSAFEIKPNTKIGDNTIIHPFATVGRNVMIGSGCIIGHHAHIEDDCFIASGTILGGNVHVRKGSFLGLGCVIRDKITIGEHCVIGAGVTLQEGAEAGSVYMNTSCRLMPFKSDKISY
jgi:sugar O-acyltransferase (sialic acid O-acetyltransferase NeuD family)